MLARVKDFLQSENGRQKILYCIKNRIPLVGSPDIPESGVSQCRLLGLTDVTNVQQQLSALLKASEVVTLPSESATQPAADKDKVQDDPPVSGADSMELDVADGQAVDIQPDK
ncbi:unnamed protein product, partial [Symbiodinium sp. CCMP2456]